MNIIGQQVKLSKQGLCGVIINKTQINDNKLFDVACRATNSYRVPLQQLKHKVLANRPLSRGRKPIDASGWKDYPHWNEVPNWVMAKMLHVTILTAYHIRARLGKKTCKKRQSKQYWNEFLEDVLG